MSEISTEPASGDESARPKPRKKTGKVKGASARRGPGKRLVARLAHVPLVRIQLSGQAEGAGFEPRALGGIPESFQTLLVLQQLPVLTPDKDDPTTYRVLGHERIVRWIKELVEADDLPLDTIVAVIVPDLGVTPEQARLVEAYLLPLELGQLSRADARAARKALKEGGMPLPRQRTRREQLKPLIKKRGGA